MANEEVRGNSRDARCHHRPRLAAPLYPNSSSADFSARLHTLPVLNNASNSACFNPVRATGACTLRGVPRSFDSIDSDNERRPRGLWHDFLESFDSLEFDSSESKDRIQMKSGLTSVEFTFTPVSSCPITEGLEFPLFKSKSLNDGTKEEGQEVSRTPRPATAPPPEKSEQYYSMDYSNGYERSLLDRSSSLSTIGRKNAGRSKERRVRSLPQALLTTSQSTRKTNSDLDWRVETTVEPSFTHGILPRAITDNCPIHKRALEDESEEGLNDDSAKADGSFVARFDVVVASEQELRDEMEPDSASSFETRMAQAQRDAQLDQSANSRSSGSVRKVAGTSDRKRVTRLNKEYKKKTKLEKPNRFLYPWLCSSQFTSAFRSR